jgi:hypothetical protein
LLLCIDRRPGGHQIEEEAMQRRTAVAAASAISMTLVSAVIFAGANLGVLGFAAPSNPSSSSPVAATEINRAEPTTTSRVEPSATSPSRTSERGDDERTPATQRVEREHDDD